MLDVGDCEGGGAAVDHRPRLADGAAALEHAQDVLHNIAWGMAPPMPDCPEEVKVPREDRIRFVEYFVPKPTAAQTRAVSANCACASVVIRARGLSS
jgi:hypothetical protein